MNDLLKRLAESANDVGSFTRSLAEKGIRSVRGGWERLPLVGSLSALSAKDVDRDETHYVLVPRPRGQWSLFTKRVLPEGIGATNSLPKARIFHVPDEAALEAIEERLVEASVLSRRQDSEESAGDRLEAMAEEFDAAANGVSGGLLLIGGAVALANPVVGVGIAISALLPAISSKVAKAGAEAMSERLRNRQEARMTRDAEGEVRRMKPEIFENPVLASLDVIFTPGNESYDPFLEIGIVVEAFDQFRYFQVTMEAIREVYAPDLKGEGDRLSPEQEAWIRNLAELDEVS